MAAAGGSDGDDLFDYAILGVGEIAEAIVVGLCEGIDDAPRILLSPRNVDRSRALAARYGSVEVAGDNQELVDRSADVVLAVRPPDVERILRDVRFRAEQAIISLVAGVPVARLAQLVAPAREISRTIPLPAVARRAGITAVHPPSATARQLFERLGEVAEIDEPEAFEVVTASTATFAAHFEYLATIAEWMVERGVPEEASRKYVAAMFAGLAHTLGASDGDLEMLIRSHSTPGGLNERFAEMLRSGGAPELVERSLDRIYEGLPRSEGDAQA